MLSILSYTVIGCPLSEDCGTAKNWHATEDQIPFPLPSFEQIGFIKHSKWR